MAQEAPGKVRRKGITLLELTRLFPDESAARKWFESIIWPDGERFCPKCGGECENTHECSHQEMPYRCRDCRKYFSVKTATVMAGSPIPLLKWLYAIYLDATSLKGVASMKLHRASALRKRPRGICSSVSVRRLPRRGLAFCWRGQWRSMKPL